MDSAPSTALTSRPGLVSSLSGQPGEQSAAARKLLTWPPVSGTKVHLRSSHKLLADDGSTPMVVDVVADAAAGAVRKNGSAYPK